MVINDRHIVPRTIPLWCIPNTPNVFIDRWMGLRGVGIAISNGCIRTSADRTYDSLPFVFRIIVVFVLCSLYYRAAVVFASRTPRITRGWRGESSDDRRGRGGSTFALTRCSQRGARYPEYPEIRGCPRY